MADKKISQLTELTSVDRANDQLAIVDDNANETKRVKINNLSLVGNVPADTVTITEIRKLTSGEYSGITPVASTLYIISQ